MEQSNEMADVYALYLDDSGTRAPDHVVGITAGKHDWFALGGMLLREADQEAIVAEYDSFRSRWPQLPASAPLHSSDIRMMKGAFSFLSKDADSRGRFLSEMTALMTGLAAHAHACVIDRAGYRGRYTAQFGDEKWLYCKTAFSVVVERAAKFVHAKRGRLRIYVEETDRVTDRLIAAYYRDLLHRGMPFTTGTSAKYGPLSEQGFRETLYGLKMKRKTSALMQLADLYLWPMCKAAYAENVAYEALRASGRLIDSVLHAEDVSTVGIKYSCFDDRNHGVRTSAFP